MAKNRTFVVTERRKTPGSVVGHINLIRVDAPRIDAAFVVILGRRANISRVRHLGNGVHEYQDQRGDVKSTYYVADVEAMQAKT